LLHFALKQLIRFRIGDVVKERALLEVEPKGKRFRILFGGTTNDGEFGIVIPPLRGHEAEQLHPATEVDLCCFSHLSGPISMDAIPVRDPGCRDVTVSEDFRISYCKHDRLQLYS